MTSSTPFQQLVRQRRSIRSFLPEALPEATIRAALDDARHAPSNSNIQPWLVHIASGATRDALSAAMLAAGDTDALTPDFPWGSEHIDGVYRERQRNQGTSYYKALGVARDALDDRHELVRRNLSFFGAPHVALLFMPTMYDGVRTAGDVGMFAQNFLLSLADRGLSGVPQTYLGMFAQQAREVLDIDPAHRLLFGISFGKPDLQSPASQFQIARAPLEELVTFHH